MGALSGAIGFVASELAGIFMTREERAESELRKQGLGTKMDEAKQFFEENNENRNFNKFVGRPDINPGQYRAAEEIYNRMIKGLSPEIKFWTTLDLNPSHEGFKIGPYHFQNIGSTYTVHFERNILTNFEGHVFWESWRP